MGGWGVVREKENHYARSEKNLVDVSDIFYFCRLGAGEGGGPTRWGKGGGTILY